MSDVTCEMAGHVALLEMHRPPHNFFDTGLIADIALNLEELDKVPDCRAVVLAAEGRSFCAGAALSGKAEGRAQPLEAASLYDAARRIYACSKPIVAAVQGPAIRGGLGLAMACDSRVGCAQPRLSANFTALRFHPGFGLTVTLPRIVGHQKAALLFLTSRRIKGEEAYGMGLLDRFVGLDEVRAAALALARELSDCGPLAVQATRATLRRGLCEAVDEALEHELAVQTELQATNDYREGVAAVSERRAADFTGT